MQQRTGETKTMGTRVERADHRGAETLKNWNKVHTRLQGCKAVRGEGRPYKLLEVKA